VNHYKTLGVGFDAPQDAIRRNYKQLALFYHPDKQAQLCVNASAQFSEISAAYAVLSDPLRRLVYDLVLGIRDKTDSEVRVHVVVARAKVQQQAKRKRTQVVATHQAVTATLGLCPSPHSCGFVFATVTCCVRTHLLATTPLLPNHTPHPATTPSSISI
jgi:preprotein translocase subunit Sec63